MSNEGIYTKRWNRWGNIKTNNPVPAQAYEYLTNVLGKLEHIPDVSRQNLLLTVPDSRLPVHPLVDVSAETRLDHKSFDPGGMMNPGKLIID